MLSPTRGLGGTGNESYELVELGAPLPEPAASLPTPKVKAASPDPGTVDEGSEEEESPIWNSQWPTSQSRNL